MNVPERIKQLRIENNLTTTELANLCNISQSVISKLENNNRIPDVPTIQLICNALDITLSDFFNDGSNAVVLPSEVKELVEASKGLTPQQLELVTELIKTIK